MNERVRRCEGATTPCFPLAWTVSPAALQVAPDLLRWYYAQAAATGRDWFVLPPSGHLYAYPGEMGPADQASFVLATEEDAALLNASGTVSWEWATTWPAAIARFFPRYAARGVIQAIFAVNVPFMLPVLSFAPGERYRILEDGAGERVVLFAPREWRGNGTALIPLGELKSPQVGVREWVCVCVCVCVRAHECLCACARACVFVCVRAWVSVRTHAPARIPVCICVRALRTPACARVRCAFARARDGTRARTIERSISRRRLSIGPCRNGSIRLGWRVP
jgi:hypothetical protein